MATHSKTLEDGTIVALEESTESDWVHLRISKGRVHRSIAVSKREAVVIRDLLVFVGEP